MSDQLSLPESDVPPAEPPPPAEQSENFISRSWLDLNLLWQESNVARGITGAILGALLTVPFGHKDWITVGIGLGAFAFAQNLIPWREFLSPLAPKERLYQRQLERYTAAIQRDPTDGRAYFWRGL